MRQRTILSNAEHEKLVEVTDAFSDVLGMIVATSVALMPPELEDLTLAFLQDKCSVYGVDFHSRLEDIRKRKGQKA